MIAWITKILMSKKNNSAFSVNVKIKKYVRTWIYLVFFLYIKPRHFGFLKLISAF